MRCEIEANINLEPGKFGFDIETSEERNSNIKKKTFYETRE